MTFPARPLVGKILLSELYQGAVDRKTFHCESCGGECTQQAAFCPACGARFMPGYTEREVAR